LGGGKRETISNSLAEERERRAPRFMEKKELRKEQKRRYYLGRGESLNSVRRSVGGGGGGGLGGGGGGQGCGRVFGQEKNNRGSSIHAVPQN